MSFVAYYTTLTGEERVEIITSAGVSQGAFPTQQGWAGSYGEVHPQGDAVALLNASSDAWLYQAGAQAWAYGRGNGDIDSSEELHTLALLTNGDAILPVFDYVHAAQDKTVRILRITPGRVITTISTLTPSEVSVLALTGNAYGRPVSSALSQDESTLFLLFATSDAASSEDKAALVAVDLPTGSVLWEHMLGSVRPTGLHAAVKRVPGSDTLIVTGVDRDSAISGSWVQWVQVAARYDFPTGIANAPARAWVVTVLAGADSSGLAVDTDRAYVGVASFSSPPQPAVIALDLSDGSVAWSFTSEAGYGLAGPDGIAVGEGRVMLGLFWDDELFGSEYGFVLLDASSGGMLSEGVFPLEVQMVGPVAWGGGGPEPDPGTVRQDPTDRLRSSVSEDLGSLLDSVEAVPVDARVDVAFTNAVSLEPAVLTAFREVTRDVDSGPVDFRYYPRPRQNTRMEEQFDGVTVLSRLANWYPPRIYGATSDFGLPTPATAPQVVSYVLSQWAQQQPWLTFKPVPDLRLPNGRAPSEYGAGEGVVSVSTITIHQEEGRRMSALDILHDLLSPFPGTVVRQDSDGDLVIIPAYGPDADETPVLALRPIDAYSVSTGKPDPFNTVNRATFNSAGGMTRQDNVPVMQPAWFQIGSNYRLGNAAGWFEPPTDRVNLQPPRGGDDTLQESLSSGQFGAQKPNLWPAAADSIAAGPGVSLRDQFNDPTITTHWRVFGPGGGLSHDGAGTVTILSPTVPFDGRWVDAFRLSFDLYSLTMRARWREDARGIELSLGPAVFEANCWAGCWTAIVEVTLNDSSVAYAEAGSESATFGVVETGDSLPGAGGNAVAESQAAFGILERTINVTGYALDLATLAAAARGYVLYNITPRVTREVELAVGAQGATFDLVGRLVSLPNGEVGVLTGLTYADDFTTPPGSWAKSARVQLLDASAAGAIPPGAFEGSLTDTAGIALTDTAGNLIYQTGAN